MMMYHIMLNRNVWVQIVFSKEGMKGDFNSVYTNINIFDTSKNFVTRVLLCSQEEVFTLKRNFKAKIKVKVFSLCHL